MLDHYNEKMLAWKMVQSGVLLTAAKREGVHVSTITL